MIFLYFEIDVPKFIENESENAENLIVIFIKSEKSRWKLRNKGAKFSKHGENVKKRFKNRQNYICKNCDNNHKLKNCFLALNKNRKIFKNKMKNSEFRKQIKSFRQIESQ